MLSALGIARRLLSNLLRGCRLWGRWQLDPSTSGLGESDGNGLLGGARAVLSCADVLNFFANELAGLRRWGLSLSLVLLG
jgi:hypothetical protein